MFYTYVLLCDNGAYYKGFTNNLEHRYQQHVNGKGARTIHGKTQTSKNCLLRNL